MTQRSKVVASVLTCAAAACLVGALSWILFLDPRGAPSTKGRENTAKELQPEYLIAPQQESPAESLQKHPDAGTAIPTPPGVQTAGLQDISRETSEDPFGFEIDPRKLIQQPQQENRGK